MIDCRRTAMVGSGLQPENAGNRKYSSISRYSVPISSWLSKQMLKHYSHIGMEAKRRAVQSLVVKKSATAPAETQTASSEADMMPFPKDAAKESTKVTHLN